MLQTLIKYEQTPLDFEEDFGSILSKNTFTGKYNIRSLSVKKREKETKISRDAGRDIFLRKVF